MFPLWHRCENPLLEHLFVRVNWCSKNHRKSVTAQTLPEHYKLKHRQALLMVWSFHLNPPRKRSSHSYCGTPRLNYQCNMTSKRERERTAGESVAGTLLFTTHQWRERKSQGPYAARGAPSLSCQCNPTWHDTRFPSTAPLIDWNDMTKSSGGWRWSALSMRPSWVNHSAGARQLLQTLTDHQSLVLFSQILCFRDK